MNKRFKIALNRAKNTVLLRLFGVKPKRNRLKFKRIKVSEREISHVDFNNWMQNVRSIREKGY